MKSSYQHFYSLTRKYSLTRNYSLMRKQSGAALFIALVILAVLSVIGISGMQNSGMELKMISSAHDRNVAFQAAETVLMRVELQLDANPPDIENHYNGCQGNHCFTANCDNGLCFDGSFLAEGGRSSCYVADPASTNQRDFWENNTVWEQAQHHQIMNVDGLNKPVKYIIEFLCFTNISAELGSGYNTQADDSTSENENYKPMYRITAVATGNAERATVILQSTYRIARDS